MKSYPVCEPITFLVWASGLCHTFLFPFELCDMIFLSSVISALNLLVTVFTLVLVPYVWCHDSFHLQCFTYLISKVWHKIRLQQAKWRNPTILIEHLALPHTTQKVGYFMASSNFLESSVWLEASNSLPSLARHGTFSTLLGVLQAAWEKNIWDTGHMLWTNPDRKFKFELKHNHCL